MTVVVDESPERAEASAEGLANLLDEDERAAVSKCPLHEVACICCASFLTGDVQRELDLLEASMLAQGCHSNR